VSYNGFAHRQAGVLADATSIEGGGGGGI